jgi:AbiV family abortive infection protein
MRTKKPRGDPLTPEILSKYRDAALVNAEELLKEAALLNGAGHHARSYFLAVASIEETGKAIQAFDGIGRNLANPAVRSKLQTLFSDHSQKVTSAFTPWLLATPDLRKELMALVNTMIDVKHGREPSMYVDMVPDGCEVVMPGQVVRPSAAKDCIGLALQVLARAKVHVQNTTPTKTTTVQDTFFALNQQTFLKMANTSDFWEFFISKAEAGDKALESAVTEYHDKYLTKGRVFKPSE